MSAKGKLIVTLGIFAMVPLFMVLVAWYLGLFSVARLAIRQYPEQLALLRGFRGGYNHGSQSVYEVQQRLLSLGISCRPVLIFYDDEKKVVKPNMAGEGGCIVPARLLANEGEVLRKIPGGTFHVAVSRAHPVFAMRKNLELLREKLGSELSFPLVLIAEDSGEQVLRPLQVSMQK